MRVLWIIARRELWSYLTSPVAYVVAAIFLAIVGFLFYGVAKLASERSMQLLQFQGILASFNVVQLVFRPIFQDMALVLVFVLPLLTMRLFAEERRQRTYDLLFSAPISVMAIVGGKFLAAVLIYTALLVLTFVLPAMLGQWTTFPLSTLVSAYFGLWLLGLVFIGVGLFASALTEYQIVAAFTGIGILIVLWVTGLVAHDTEITTVSTVLKKMSVSLYFEEFVQGLVNTTSIVFFLSFMLFWLTVAYRVVEANRWR